MKPNYEHRDEDLQAQQSLIKYRPIIFSRAMIHALQDGAKIQTRRPVNPKSEVFKWLAYGISTPELEAAENNMCPYGNPGDVLWVREAAQCVGFLGNNEYPDGHWIYKADFSTDADLSEFAQYEDFRWRPSIHMPREACRIYLEVVSRKLQRIQDITADQCMHEGVEFADDMGLLLTSGPVSAFAHLWDKMYGSHEWKAWSKNPLVWAVQFRKLQNHQP